MYFLSHSTVIIVPHLRTTVNEEYVNIWFQFAFCFILFSQLAYFILAHIAFPHHSYILTFNIQSRSCFILRTPPLISFDISYHFQIRLRICFVILTFENENVPISFYINLTRQSTYIPIQIKNSPAFHSQNRISHNRARPHPAFHTRPAMLN